MSLFLTLTIVLTLTDFFFTCFKGRISKLSAHDTRTQQGSPSLTESPYIEASACFLLLASFGRSTEVASGAEKGYFFPHVFSKQISSFFCEQTQSSLTKNTQTLAKMKSKPRSDENKAEPSEHLCKQRLPHQESLEFKESLCHTCLAKAMLLTSSSPSDLK